MTYLEWLTKWGIQQREAWLSTRWIGGSGAFQPQAITRMTEHYMGGDGIDCSNTPRLLNQMQASYVTSRGYDLGYSFGVDERGILWEIRGLRVMAASDGWPEINVQTVSCLAMRPNIADDLLPGMITAQQNLMTAVRERTGRPVEHWIKHRDANPSTGCCGVPIGARVDAGQLEPHTSTPIPGAAMPTLITVTGVVTLVSPSPPPTHIYASWVETQAEADRLAGDPNVAKQTITPEQCAGIRLLGVIPANLAGLFHTVIPGSTTPGPVQDHTHDITLGGSGNVRR